MQTFPEKIAIIPLTTAARELADKIRHGLGKSGWNLNGVEIISAKPGIRAVMGQAWNGFDGLVCIMATGIAVRSISPLLQDKWKDPAVVVVSQDGKFAIPILSGHLGGANELARRIAGITGGQAVITTASDVAGKTAIDIWLKGLGLKIHHQRGILTRLMMRLVERGSLRIFSSLPLPPLPPDIQQCNRVEQADMIITHENRYDTVNSEDTLILHPPVIAIGIGCNRGTEEKQIEDAIVQGLLDAGISIGSLFRAGSIDLKSDEPGLIATCRRHNIELQFFSADELNQAAGREPRIKRSDAVFRATGAVAVCEPAAILAANSGKLIMEKRIWRDVTVAAALDASPWWGQGRETWSC